MANQQEPWYHGPMTAERATKICARVGQNGAFLVRESQAVKGAFTLSIFFEEEVYHHRIKMTSENKCHFEATNQDFQSLKDIVDYFMKPQESLIHPLTIAIYPSLIQQMDSDDKEWEKNIIVNQPTYDRVQRNNFPNSQNHFPPTPVPTPKPEHVYDKGVLSTIKTPPSQPEQNTVSTEQQEDYWPAPPPCAWTEKPEVKPKPKTHQLGCGSGRSARPNSCYFPRSFNPSVDIPWQDDSSIGKNESRGGRISNLQRNPSLDINFSRMQIKNKTDTAASRRNNGKPHNTPTMAMATVSPMNNRKPRNVSTTAMATCTSSSSQRRKTKKNNTTTSSLKAFTHLFRKKKCRPSHEVKVSENKQPTESTQVYDNDPDFIPIICKTRFVATIDCPGQPGAMAFKKGTEMVIKGVRVDGWWYCLNKLTKESNWVYQDYLKPQSEGEWFEAKPVETNDDQRVYETFDGDSDFDDDENYCRYLLPEDDSSRARQDDLYVLAEDVVN